MVVLSRIFEHAAERIEGIRALTLGRRRLARTLPGRARWRALQTVVGYAWQRREAASEPWNRGSRQPPGMGTSSSGEQRRPLHLALLVRRPGGWDQVTWALEGRRRSPGSRGLGESHVAAVQGATERPLRSRTCSTSRRSWSPDGRPGARSAAGYCSRSSPPSRSGRRR